MIKNERQYRITKARVEKFSRALNALAERIGGDPLLRQLEEDALRSQLQELIEDISEYEELKAGTQGILAANSLNQLPRMLIQARVASGLTQRDLASRLGLKEQMIQTYEATDYAGASLSRIEAVVRALGIDIRLVGR